MIDKKLLISGLASTPLIGGSIVAIVLSQTNPDEKITKVSFKDKLIKQGYKEVQSFGAKITLLRQYSDFKNDKGDLSQWCNQNKITEEDDEKLIKEFKAICFETFASKIEGPEIAILRTGPDSDEDNEAWNTALANFKKAFETSSNEKPSNNWTNTDQLKDFQEQCKKHEREQFFDEENELFKEVKKYCTRKRGTDS